MKTQFSVPYKLFLLRGVKYHQVEPQNTNMVNLQTDSHPVHHYILYSISPRCFNQKHGGPELVYMHISLDWGGAQYPEGHPDTPD